MNILLIEDNENIIKGLEYTFSKSEYNLISKTTVQDSTKYLQEFTPNLIVLDISLPDEDGFTLFKNHIKHKNIPVIFLTAFDDENTVVKCLDFGAEDYMTKPFSPKELISRINKIILRQKKNNIIQIENIAFDADKMTVQKDNREIILSSLELKILEILFSNLNKIVTRESILEHIWEWTGNDVDDHTVTVYINRIREKLGSDIIKTIKGMGYRIDEK